MAQVLLRDVSKSYASQVALHPLTLTIEDGEFLTLLGPSGCGKTTTLRMVAGFVEPSSGKIAIGQEDVTRLSPQHRQIGMVFQDYALFPHLTIAQNIGFGLVERKYTRKQIDARVDELLNLIQLPHVGDRYPGQISGGQQQRVAVARAVAFPPRVLLMDEPLGALDLKLREAMQLEIRNLQKALGITTIYVTHDQTEAMTMSDRIAVMSGGRIEQLATPEEIYHRPKTKFVAEFIGKVNTLTLPFRSRAGGFDLFDAAGEGLRVVAAEGAAQPGQRALAVRPENIALLRGGAMPGPDANALRGTVTGKVFGGSHCSLSVQLEAGAVWIVDQQSSSEMAETGEQVVLSWRPEHTVALAG